MKISKLFHWLYAFLMALPIFAVLSTCLISTFNMQSKEESEVHYRYKTNEVTSNSGIINHNIYLVNLYDFNNDFGIENLFSPLTTDSYIKLTWDNRPDYELSLDITRTQFDDSAMPLYENVVYLSHDSVVAREFSYGWFDNVVLGTFGDLMIYYVKDGQRYFDVPFVIEISNLGFVHSQFYNYIKPVTDLSLIPIDYVETSNLDTQAIFYNAIDKVKQSPLFNWAYDSFLVTPFSYIVSLFSMPANSFVVQMLSYWLAISIIWLVFDLVMYVPLLVHRWLDKGVLE